MKVIDEVRNISSKKIAEKQKSSENNYPKLIDKIKAAASFGKTSCELKEHEVDVYSKRLLEADGFTVYSTTKKEENKYYEQLRQSTISVWIVSW